MMPSPLKFRFVHIVSSLATLSLCCGLGAIAADGDHESLDESRSGAAGSFILTQPEPYTRAHEYFTAPVASVSTLTPNAFTSGLPYVFGNSYYGYGGGFPLGGLAAPGIVPPIGALGLGYGSYSRYGGWTGNWGSWGGWGRGGLGWGYGGPGWGGYGTGYGAPGFGGFINNGYGGWGGALGGFNSGYFGNPFTSGSMTNGYWGGYGMSGFGGYGYSGFGCFGGLGFGGGTSLGLTQPSHVVQTEPSKASGNYYAPSTVDTTASGSYYAQTSGTAVQLPAKRPSTNSNYWKQDSNSNYWGSGGGSSTPFGKDLNSVPWNK
ncbi:MAG TPA: hypothetical protein V6C86_04155 [Oculatellaceae cyanobacterium]